MKISNIIKLFPVVYILTIAVICLSLNKIYISINKEINLSMNSQKYKQISSDFEEITNYLITQAKSYVNYEDKYYYDIYQEEINVLKTREAIFKQIKGLPFQDELILAEIKVLSNDLVRLDQEVFLYMIEEDIEKAKEIINSTNYNQVKDQLLRMIKNYKDITNATYSAFTTKAKGITKIWTIFAVCMVILSILILLMIFYILMKKINAIKDMVEIASQIARGELDINLERYFSNDEIGELAINFGNLIGTVKGLILDIEHLAKQHDKGNISTTIDNTKYKGAYQKVSIGLTTMANSYVSMINEISSTLKMFAIGNFTIPIKEYPGEKADISIAVLKLRDNLTSISEEINNLINAAALGQLKVKSDVNKFQGDWSDICLHLNNLLEMIFEQLINSAPMAYLLIKDGEVIEANKYAIDNLRISSENPQIRFEDKLEKEQLFKILNQEGVLNGKVVKLIDSNDKIRRYNINLFKINHNNQYCNVLWGFDIEDHESKTDTVKRAQADLNKLIDVLPLPLHIIDKETRDIVYGNKTYLELFKFSNAKDVLNKRIDILFKEKQSNGVSSLDFYKEQEDVMELGEQNYSWEFEYLTQDGEVINSKVTGENILYKDRSSFVEIIQDISLEKLQNEMLSRAAQKEREANKLKGRFLINMSHEIRTPMNAVIGLSQVALMKDQNQENMEIFNKINVSSKNLLTIINDILDFSKIEAEKLDLENELFELEDVIYNAFIVASEIISKKSIEMLLDMEPNVPAIVKGDRIRIWQILKNLLDNAAKYTEQGHIILKIRLSDIDSIPNYKSNLTYIDFIVEDTGLGMNEEQVEKIFNLFEQFHSKKSTSGTGLGMSIVKQLVELMDGEIKVSSEVNKGSSFKIRLAFSEIGEAICKKLIINEEMQKSKILIVDDDEYALKIMSNLLQNLGVEVKCVSNGIDAINLVKDSNLKKSPFNIIVLDYFLGNENGLDLASKLKLLGIGDSKLILVSAYSSQFLRKDAIELGFKDIIEKPFIPSKFIGSLCNTIGYNKIINQEESLNFSNVEVLAFEDNDINQDVVKGMLKIVGITPTIAENGEAGLEILKKKKFDLIFMDLLMPVMDGYTATKLIRENDKTTPIVAMTANVMNEEKDKCIEIGMNDYIEKPIDFDKLVKVLITYLPNISYTLKDVDDVTDLIEIDGVDINEGLKRFGMKQQSYYKSLQKFAITLNEHKLFSTENMNNIKKLQEHVHAFKGVSGNLGIKSLYKLSQDFEKSLKDEKIDFEIYSSLKNESIVVQKDILKVLQDGPIEENYENGSSIDFLDNIDKLEKSLESGDPSSSESITNYLKSKKWEHVDHTLLNKLYKGVDDYEFENSIKYISILREKLKIVKENKL